MSSMRYDDLLEKLTQPGCAVCHMIQRDVARYLDALLYEYVNKIPTHQAFRAGRGLCNTHYWQLRHTRRGSAVGTAKLSVSVLDEILRIEDQAAPMRSGLARLRGKVSALADALEPEGPCIACKTMQDSEVMYIGMIADHLNEADFQAVFRDSSGLCLPHVRLALRQMKRSSDSELFLTIQRGIWERLKAELETYVRKNQVDHLGEVIGGEGDSWLRAIALLSGEPGIFGLRR